jgi:CheY-like chemotaxis protein/anti-sigma regulatory factor (Ser/Thr protein kinase)
LVNNIRESVSSMTEMFGALLDLTRIDAGGVDPKPEAFSLEPLLGRIARDAAALAAGKSIAVRHVPTSAQVETDPVLLETILRNLATNAVRYTVTGKILIGCRRRRGDVVDIVVVDTGLGIAEADQDRIFREFERVKASGAGAAHGLGLGLAIVRRLGQALGLSVGLRSVAGRGSAFWVTVPLARSLPAPVVEEPARAVFSGSVGVLDDEPAIREGLSREFSDRGIECWAPAEPATPDPARLDQMRALVVDLNLDHASDGLAVLAEAERRLGRRLVAVMVTGSTDPATLERLERSGRPWLHKPVGADEIIEAINRALRTG